MILLIGFEPSCKEINLSVHANRAQTRVPCVNSVFTSARRLHVLTATVCSQRAWRTSPTSWPSAPRSRQSTRSCGGWPRLRAGGTGRGSSTSLRRSAPRTLRPGWNWPKSATGEAQSYSSNMMVRLLHSFVSDRKRTLWHSVAPSRPLCSQALWQRRWWCPFWGTSPAASAWIREVSAPPAAWCLSCPETPACPASTFLLPPQTPPGGK